MERDSTGLWKWLRKKEALITSPAASGGGIAAFPSPIYDTYQQHAETHAPPAEVAPGWDPMAAWLPPPTTPAPVGPPLAAPPSSLPTSAATPGPIPAPPAAKPARTGFAAAWGKLKRRLSGKKAGSKEGPGPGPGSGPGLHPGLGPSPALLEGAGTSWQTAWVPGSTPAGGSVRPMPAACHTTSALPLPGSSSSGGPARQSRIPKPPPTFSPAGSSSTPGSGSRLLGGKGFSRSRGGSLEAYSDAAGAAAATPAAAAATERPGPHALPPSQRQEDGSGSAAAGDRARFGAPADDATARRLVFSPPSGRAAAGGGGKAGLRAGGPATGLGPGSAGSAEEQRPPGEYQQYQQYQQYDQQQQQGDQQYQQLQQHQRQQPPPQRLSWQPEPGGQGSCEAGARSLRRPPPAPTQAEGLRRAGSLPIDIPSGSQSNSKSPGAAATHSGRAGGGGGGGGGFVSASAALCTLGDTAASAVLSPRGVPVTSSSASLAGSFAGSVRLSAAAEQLLGGPGRTGLAGRWVRELEGGGGGGGGGEGAAAAAAAAAVDAVLQLPPLVAAARERTRELQVAETDAELALTWTTHLSSGARIRSAPQVYPKSGALATLPRLDGRGGSAAAQLSFDIDGTVGLKALQGPPLPALIHHKLRMSASGSRLRMTLKVQLLEEPEIQGSGNGGAGRSSRNSSAGGHAGGSAKQVTLWRRVAAA